MLTLCSDAWGFLLDGELSPGGRRTHALGLPPSVPQELAGFSGLIFPQRPVPPQPLAPAPAPARIAQRSAVGQASQQVLWIRVSLLCLSSRQDPPLTFAAASPALRAAAVPPADPAAALPLTTSLPLAPLRAALAEWIGQHPWPRSDKLSILPFPVTLGRGLSSVCYSPVSIIDISEELQDHLAFHHFWREME